MFRSLCRVIVVELQAIQNTHSLQLAYAELNLRISHKQYGILFTVFSSFMGLRSETKLFHGSNMLGLH